MNILQLKKDDKHEIDFIKLSSVLKVIDWMNQVNLFKFDDSSCLCRIKCTLIMARVNEFKNS